ncbi:MAG: S49 family peptidase [Bacteroidota bacterium]
MNIINEILNGVWAIEKQMADGHLLIVKAMLEGKSIRPEASELERAKQRMADFACVSSGVVHRLSTQGFEVSPEMAPENSVALIAVSGAITKNDQSCGPAGMKTKSDLIKRCDANPNINSIILQIESGGGEGYAARHLCETIKNTQKPVIAFVEDLAASAAYYIASACNHIVVNTDMARVGSIGTYATIIDYRGALEKEGIKMIEVYATKSNEKNKEYFDAINGDTSLLKKSMDVFNDRFLADVAENRGSKMKSDWKTWGTGSVFFAPEALKIGLIDEIDTLENTIKSLIK